MRHSRTFKVDGWGFRFDGNWEYDLTDDLDFDSHTVNPNYS